jgi:hypothetical protein
MGIVLIIVVLLLVFGGLPQISGHSYGYGPSGLGLVLLIVLLFLVFGGRL